LKELGLDDRCEFVYNGEEAVVQFSKLTNEKKYVSHILTDFMMPRLNGIQATERILDYVSHRNKHSEE
jgi:CheY-like chemotaxis protein